MSAYAVKIARICHEANRAWCEINGDRSQPSWEHAPVWQKDSALNWVWFHINNPTPTAGPEGSHENWMREKSENGWTYGETKDPNADPPTHPCMVPFRALPIDQQVKYVIFHGIVHAMLHNVEGEMA